MKADIIIIGGGIAGVSAAAYLGQRADVVLVEAETSLGYHATGRSAAMYTECYGSELIRRLAKASRPFFASNGEAPGTPRPVMFVAPLEEPDAVTATYNMFKPLVPTLQELSAGEVAAYCDAIVAGRCSGGVLEPLAMELDVHGIESSFKEMAKSGNTEIVLSLRIDEIVFDGESWHVGVGGVSMSAPILVNASGAWGDQIAVLAGVAPLGLRPLKRSAFVFDPQRQVESWPLVVDIGERWYLKPEGSHLLGSAASELPSEPVDARHDELDVALGIERINGATDLGIRSIINAWAGLRTFTPDRAPAVGFDPAAPGFFWLVGQGGYGIKTAPAIGQLTAGIILDSATPDLLSRAGVSATDLDPSRFRT